MSGWRRIALGLAVVGVVVGAPVLGLERVVSRAGDCFASIEQPRDAALPDCSHDGAVLRWVAKVPLMGSHALRVSEELDVRRVTMRYIDAAVGAPDALLLRERHASLRDVARAIDAGTARLRFDELGPPLRTPHPGDLAALVGDDGSLDEHALSLTQHYNEKRAMAAALVRADVDRAVRLARHYAGRPNTDLRIEVAALLCVGGLTDRALQLVVDVEDARAAKRTANFSRHFGDVRVVIESCAMNGSVKAPPVPAYGQAGDWDQRARVMAMRMRRLRQQHPDCVWSATDGCRSDGVVESNISHIRDLLGADKRRSHRLELVAIIADTIVDGAEALTLATPRDGEPTLADRMPRLVGDWVSRSRDEPFVSSRRWGVAAESLALLGDAGLTSVIAACRHRQLIGAALAGDGDQARAVIELSDPGDRALLRANVALLAGDRDGARAALATASGAHADLLRAELALPDEVTGRAAAEVAVASARASGNTRLLERARWLAMALGSPTALAVSDGAPPPRLTVMGWANPSMPVHVREGNHDTLLKTWADWLAADGPARRAHRYTLFRHRGDAPEALVGYLFALGKLAKGAGDVEAWLDAALARDQRRFGLRRYAFARWRAAAWRADREASEIWRRRFVRLAELSQGEEHAELLQTLRL